MSHPVQENAVPGSLVTAPGELQQELGRVEAEIESGLQDLLPPFYRLAHSQWQRSYPLKRAAIVLAVGFGAPDTPELRAQRIALGAALEMLHLALAIHAQLLAHAGSGHDGNRSVLGSTILAGDYCFSRAAELAVRTNNPEVVDIFAQALRRISEGQLRHLFVEQREGFDDSHELSSAGVRAAGTLAQLSEPAQKAAAVLIDQLVGHGRSDRVVLEDEQLAAFAPRQRERWRAFAAWLAQ